MEELLKNLTENDGATLKNYKSISYKSGYQVATEGIATKSIKRALKAIDKYKGDCGVWFSKGIYYIDKSHRVATKKEALKIGKECNQQSILKWKDKSLVWV